MHKILVLFIVVFCCQRPEPTQFSEAALNDTFIGLDGTETVFKNILAKHPNKTIVIDVWANWCRDCIVGLPKIKALQAAHPEVVFLFLSLDKTQSSWKKGLEKHAIKGQHYYMQSGWDGAFGTFIDLDWIPRYMVVKPNGNITLFKAIKADDDAIAIALK